MKEKRKKSLDDWILGLGSALVALGIGIGSLSGTFEFSDVISYICLYIGLLICVSVGAYKLSHKTSTQTVISIVIFEVSTFIVINHFAQIIPFQETKIQGADIFLPYLINLFGILLGVIGYKKIKNKHSLWAIILNIFMFCVPFLYMTLGVLIWGVNAIHNKIKLWVIDGCPS